jgi:hypothetical protein
VTGFADPMTTRGDIIFRDSSNTTARLGRGTADQVLRSDGTDLSWQTLTKSDVGLGNVENTALSTWPGSSNLTTVGTLTSGSTGAGFTVSLGTSTFTGTLLAANGGTGMGGYSAGDLLVGSATGSLARLGAGANGQVLTVSGGVPSYSTATYPSTAGSSGNAMRSNGTNFVSAAPGNSPSTPTAPTSTTRTTGVKMGLAGSITPTTSGKVLIVISGDIDNDTGADGAQVQIRTGTGTAPANGASLTGTTQGALVKIVNPNASGVGVTFTPGRQAFTVNAVVSGLTLNAANWIDISLAAITGGTARVRDVSISAIEL